MKLDSFVGPGINIVLDNSETIRGEHISYGVCWVLCEWWRLGRCLVLFSGSLEYRGE